jgi:hypothetical protein
MTRPDPDAMTPAFDPLERIAFLEREVARLREGEECHVARPGEGTYECRHDNLCAACRLRSAEARANRTSYTVGETEWAHRIAVAERRYLDAEAECIALRALLVDAHRELATIEAITVSPSGVDGLVELVNRIGQKLESSK